MERFTEVIRAISVFSGFSAEFQALQARSQKAQENYIAALREAHRVRDEELRRILKGGGRGVCWKHFEDPIGGNREEKAGIFFSENLRLYLLSDWSEGGKIKTASLVELCPDHAKAIRTGFVVNGESEMRGSYGTSHARVVQRRGYLYTADEYVDEVTIPQSTRYRDEAYEIFKFPNLPPFPEGK